MVSDQPSVFSFGWLQIVSRARFRPKAVSQRTVESAQNDRALRACSALSIAMLARAELKCENA
jgi:hypothetical protein